MNCKHCYRSTFQTSCAKEFVRHFQFAHKIGPKTLMTCGFDECLAKFKDPELSYEPHIEKFHVEGSVPEDRSSLRSVEVAEVYRPHEKEKLSCPYPSCNFIANSNSGLRGHKFWSHPREENNDNIRTDRNAQKACAVESNVLADPPAVVDDNNSIERVSAEQNDENNGICSNIDSYCGEEEKTSLLKKVAHLFLTLNSKFHVPDSTLNFIRESYALLINQSMRLTRREVCKKMSQFDNISKDSVELVLKELFENCLSTIHDDHGPLRSTHKRREQYAKLFKFVEPRQVYLGLDQNNDPRKFHYVPLRKSLERLFEDESVYKQYVERKNTRYVTSDKLKDIQDGLAFQHNAFFSDNPGAVQIILYQDDAELTNPLGSSKGTYKMSAYYYTVGNIHSWNRSRSDTLQLVILCAERDVAYFGLKHVLKPLLDDLKLLESTGFLIRGETVKASLFVLLGDNLGTHTVAGFLENFSAAKFFCRYCEESREQWLARWYGNANKKEDSSHDVECSSDDADETDSSVSTASDYSTYDACDPSDNHINCMIADSESDEEDNIPLGRRLPAKRKVPIRTKDSYNACVAAVTENPGEGSVKGVVADSQFNALSYYHVVNGTPPCVAHDLFEGVVAYDISLALRKLSLKFKFPFEYMNRTVRKFNFLGADALDRPPSKFSSLKKKITGHAAQNWVLLRFLPLLIGQRVQDKADPVWRMILMLIELVQIICSPVISRSSLKVLDKKISEYLQLRVKLFKEKLRPKHKFLEHYPYLTTVYGPLMRCSTLSFERKHKFFKETLRSKKNMKNPTKLLSTEHQLMQSALSVNPLFCNEANIENAVSYSDLDCKASLLKYLADNFGIEVASKLLYAERASVHNAKYEKGRVVIVSSQRFPILDVCTIELLFTYDGSLLAIGIKGNAVLDPELQIYKISETSSMMIIRVSEIDDFVAYPVYTIQDKQFIVLKHLCL